MRQHASPHRIERDGFGNFMQRSLQLHQRILLSTWKRATMDPLQSYKLQISDQHNWHSSSSNCKTDFKCSHGSRPDSARAPGSIVEDLLRRSEFFSRSHFPALALASPQVITISWVQYLPILERGCRFLSFYQKQSFNYYAGPITNRIFCPIAKVSRFTDFRPSTDSTPDVFTALIIRLLCNQ